jgi:hypothetical protein
MTLGPVPKRGLPGTYTCKYPYGIERLTPSADGHYTQTFKRNDVASYSNAGTWSVDSEDKLVINDAIIVDED